MINQSKLNAVVPFLPCSNVEETLTYYRDVLGFTCDWVWGEPTVAAGASCDGVRLFFNLDTDMTIKMRGFRLYLDVDGVEDLFTSHKAAGAVIVDLLEEKPWGTLEYTVEEINGYLLHFRRAPE